MGEKQTERLAESAASFLRCVKIRRRPAGRLAEGAAEFLRRIRPARRQVGPVTFARAQARVDFALIERRHDALSADAAAELARLAARAARRALTDERLAEMLAEGGRGLDTVGRLSLEGSDVGRVKAGFKDALRRAWQAGEDSARTELGRARAPAAAFADLRDAAAEWIEANGFRMAANLADGMRAVIQQELLLGVKNGLRPDTMLGRIYDRLIRKGFTTLAAIQREEPRADVLERVEELLADTLGAADVPAYLNTLIRTNTFEALNEARHAAFQDPALDGLVVAYEYAAILDDRTTEICRELDGGTWASGSEVWDRYRPPNHYNCRSLLVPVLATDGWDGVESPQPAVEPQEGFK